MVTPGLTFRELPGCLPQRLHHFTLPPATYEGSDFSTSSAMLVATCLFDSSHASGYLTVVGTHIS